MSRTRRNIEDSGKHRFHGLEHDSKMRLFEIHSHTSTLRGYEAPGKTLSRKPNTRRSHRQRALRWWGCTTTARRIRLHHGQHRHWPGPQRGSHGQVSAPPSTHVRGRSGTSHGHRRRAGLRRGAPPRSLHFVTEGRREHVPNQFFRGKGRKKTGWSK